MGYAVLHLDKAPGNEVAMTAHIARTKIPTNASPERTSLCLLYTSPSPRDCS